MRRPVATEGPRPAAGAAVGLLFFVNGASFSNWLPRIPEVRDRLGLSNAGLGAALLGGGLGGLLASLVVARLLGRFGSRATVLVAAVVLAGGLPLIAAVSSPLALWAVLTALGALDVCTDMAMNAQGVMIQTQLGRSIMQRLHAAWSLGFLAGAGIGSLAAAAKIPMGMHLVAVALTLTFTIVCVRNHLLAVDAGAPETPHPRAASARALSAGGPAQRGRVRVTVAMTVTAVGVAVLETIPNDWSAVALGDLLGARRLVGAGAFIYALCMLAGRLGGDHASDRLGAERLFELALLVSGVGVVVVVLAPSPAVALVGFGLWGLGVSVLFPRLYELAASLPGAGAGVGLGAMAFGQRLGFMVQPAMVGSVAGAGTLRWAIALVGGSGFVLVLTSRCSLAGRLGGPRAGRDVVPGG